MERLCVFCGSSAGSQTVYADAARRLGEALAERGLGLVFGGGHIGLRHSETNSYPNFSFRPSMSRNHFPKSASRVTPCSTIFISAGERRIPVR